MQNFVCIRAVTNDDAMMYHNLFTFLTIKMEKSTPLQLGRYTHLFVLSKLLQQRKNIISSYLTQY